MSSTDTRVYLNLYGGRKTKEEEHDGGGSLGPIVGPCRVRMVYGNLQLFKEWGEDQYFLDLEDGMIFHDGNYYSDVEILGADDEIVTGAPDNGRVILDLDTFAAGGTS